MAKILNGPLCKEIKRHTGWSNGRILLGGALSAITLVGSIIHLIVA